MKKLEFRCRGTVPGEMYTREDGVSLLCAFQDEIIRDYRERFNKSLFNRKYFTRDLEAAAEGYGLDTDPVFQDLKSGLDKTSEIISAWRNRLAGEDRARRALSRTLPGEEMEVLYGVTLRNGRERTEYDAIVITPYGVFVIEVRNYSQDMIWDEKGMISPANGERWTENLGEKMNCKELLLRNKLRDHMNIPFYSILLAADNRVEITDKNNSVPVSYLNTVMSDIRSYSNGRRYISSDDIGKVKGILLNNTAPLLVPCPVDCGRIAEEYAGFVNRCSGKGESGLWRKLRGLLAGKPVKEADIGAA